MSDLGSIPDEECAWYADGVGPMFIETVPRVGRCVWRRLNDGRRVFCGFYVIADEATAIAKVLAAVPDEAFR